MSRLKNSVLVALIAAVLAVGATQAGTWKGKEETRDGVVHVMNPDSPMERGSVIEMEEVWRIDGEDDDELFGVITAITADDEGNFYLLDAQLTEIKVYSPDGEYLRTIGREGEGPGEFRGAFGMFMVPGGKVGVLQTFPSKIILLTPEGEPGGEYPLPEPGDDGFRVLFSGENAGDNLALIYGLNKPSETGFTQTSVLALVDKAGEKEMRLHEQDSSMKAATPVIAEKEWDSFRNRWAASSDGRAFSAVDFGEYAVNVWGPDGKLERVIHRDYAEHKRTDDEKSELLEIYKGFTRRIPIPGITFEIEDVHNKITRLYTRDNGELWIQSSRGSIDLDDGVAGVFDVYDDKGRFVKQVTLKGEGDPKTDGYFFVKDRLFVVTDFLDAMMALQGGGGGEEEEEDEEVEPMQIISYKLN